MDKLEKLKNNRNRLREYLNNYNPNYIWILLLCMVFCLCRDLQEANIVVLASLGGFVGVVICYNLGCLVGSGIYTIWLYLINKKIKKLEEEKIKTEVHINEDK